MRVLLLPSWYPSDKKPLNGIFFKEQAEALKNQGIEVVVLSINIENIKSIIKERKLNKLEVKNENGIIVYRYNTYNYFPKMQELYLKYYSMILTKLVRNIEREQGKFDIVHIHSALDMGIAYSISKLDIPYVITEHSSKYFTNRINKVQDKYLSNVFENAKKVISVGEGLKEKLFKYCNSSKVEIIPNLVKLPYIEDSNSNRNNKDKITFFSLGFLTYVKGMDLLIEAYNLGKNELKDVQLIIGGNGEEYSKLKLLIEKYNLKDNIILLGELNREEVSRNMMSCDAFILTSRHETFGIVFIEAMNYGKPIVVANNGGLDSFINEKCGIIVEKNNIQKIKDAMIDMKNSYNRYDSNYIKNFCVENFSEEVIANKLIDIYRKVIKNNYVT